MFLYSYLACYDLTRSSLLMTIRFSRCCNLKKQTKCNFQNDRTTMKSGLDYKSCSLLQRAPECINIAKVAVTELSKQFEHDASRNGFFLQMLNVLVCAGASLTFQCPCTRRGDRRCRGGRRGGCWCLWLVSNCKSKVAAAFGAASQPLSETGSWKIYIS